MTQVQMLFLTFFIHSFENYRFQSGQEEFGSLLKRGKRHPKQLQEQSTGWKQKGRCHIINSKTIW